MRVSGKSMMIAFVTILFVATGLGIWNCNRKPIHISQVTINRGFDDVWTWISDPLKYERLYPHWIKKIHSNGNGTFGVDDQFGQSDVMRACWKKEFGIVDLYINLPAGEEVSRSRISVLDSKSTLLVHVARRWSGANAVVWFFHK